MRPVPSRAWLPPAEPAGPFALTLEARNYKKLQQNRNKEDRFAHEHFIRGLLLISVAHNSVRALDCEAFEILYRRDVRADQHSAGTSSILSKILINMGH